MAKAFATPAEFVAAANTTAGSSLEASRERDPDCTLLAYEKSAHHPRPPALLFSIGVWISLGQETIKPLSATLKRHASQESCRRQLSSCRKVADSRWLTALRRGADRAVFHTSLGC
jgi:hypothetical protein